MTTKLTIPELAEKKRAGERLWKSMKYEEVYLHAHDSVAQARVSIGSYLDFYNRRRPPVKAYVAYSPLKAAA